MDIEELTRDLVDAVEKECSMVEVDETEAESELDRIASIYRRAITRHGQRIYETAKNRDAAIAIVEAMMLDERKRHDEKMSRLAAQIVDEKARASRQIEADKKLRSSAEKALSEIVS